MTLRTRLAATVGVVIVLGGLVSGAINARVARESAMSRIDSVLVDALGQVRRDPDRDTSVLVQFADSSPIPISATLYFTDDDPIALVEGVDGDTKVVIPALSASEATKTMEESRTFDGSVLARSLGLGDGEWVTVAASTRDIDDQFRGSLVRSLQVSLAVALATVLVVWWLIRRSLRPVAVLTEDASRIAGGNLDVTLPVVDGRNEIARLTGALASMVGSLREAVAVTAESERDMREFLGDASHELRTPLTVIRGYVDILASGRELTDDQRERAMRRLVGESARMTGIIDDLLLLAELGETPAVTSAEVELGRLVDDHARDLIAQNPDRPVEMDVRQDMVIRGDAAHLQRMLANVFANIVRHTPETARVEVSLSGGTGHAVLVVDDAGPGLSPELYGRPTAGFQRFDKARSTEGGGFGLGLSIIASVVNAHGGTFEMTPSPLGGLRTRIVLPNGRRDA